MRRREFITLLGGAAAWPLAARAQQPPRPGAWVFGNNVCRPQCSNLLASDKGFMNSAILRDRTLCLSIARPRVAANALKNWRPNWFGVNVDIIVARGTPAILAAMKISGTIPVVMTASALPFTFVSSLARPGGNVTGLSSLSSDLYAKRLELLKETVPAATHIGMMLNPTNPNYPRNVTEAEKGARSLGLELHKFDLRTPDDISNAFERASRQRADALLIGIEAITQANAIAHHAACCKAPVCRRYMRLGSSSRPAG